MSALARRYLAHRRKLGFLLRTEGVQVINFGRFADRVAPRQPITAALALQWATLPRTAHQQFYHAKRLESLRGFARFCAVFDPRTEVPSTRLVGPAHRRLTPHIYPAGQVRLLLQRAAALPVVDPSDPLRSLTYVTLIGLIACTGLRMGEALRLIESDFDDAAALCASHAQNSARTHLTSSPPRCEHFATTGQRVAAIPPLPIGFRRPRWPPPEPTDRVLHVSRPHPGFCRYRSAGASAVSRFPPHSGHAVDRPMEQAEVSRRPSSPPSFPLSRAPDIRRDVLVRLRRSTRP